MIVALVVALHWSETQAAELQVSGFLEADEVELGSRAWPKCMCVRVRWSRRARSFELEPSISESGVRAMQRA